jgi:4-hydroxythreonine-4-phosphate dehydrogenase
VPLKKVSGLLRGEELASVILITSRVLKDWFGLKHPRLVVCGLNPHASDNGIIGEEENALIKPVLRKLKSRISHLEGPLPSDVAIARAYAQEYDAVIAMYHDQALIPLKLSNPLTGVNMTLGLPFVRTSPLHGTAFDIAGKNSALAHSLIEAIRLAVRCSKNFKYQ